MDGQVPGDLSSFRPCEFVLFINYELCTHFQYGSPSWQASVQLLRGELCGSQVHSIAGLLFIARESDKG